MTKKQGMVLDLLGDPIGIKRFRGNGAPDDGPFYWVPDYAYHALTTRPENLVIGGLFTPLSTKAPPPFDRFEELGRPYGWTDDDLFDLSVAMIQHVERTLVCPDSSLKTLAEWLDWVFSGPILARGTNAPFTFQSVCELAMICPQTKREEIHGECCREGVYTRLENNIGPSANGSTSRSPNSGSPDVDSELYARVIASYRSTFGDACEVKFRMRLEQTQQRNVGNLSFLNDLGEVL